MNRWAEKETVIVKEISDFKVKLLLCVGIGRVPSEHDQTQQSFQLTIESLRSSLILKNNHIYMLLLM